ncbi:hypothetical protein TrLO_g14292 [Triparma laevis f. longispina]|uniref:Uncharacterized protein n=1 Tax=Triparma laevis f. longispina TaxID=1714387 RepID=A0A9W7FAP9_9STRA|nr:hypothetical protein TrLO_g14292 [Triparma laevis f. longispina]
MFPRKFCISTIVHRHSLDSPPVIYFTHPSRLYTMDLEEAIKLPSTHYPILIIHPCYLAGKHPLLKEQPTAQYVFGYYGGGSTPFGRVSSEKWNSPSLVDWETGLEWGIPDKLPKLRGLELCVRNEAAWPDMRNLQELEMEFLPKQKPALMRLDVFSNVDATGTEGEGEEEDEKTEPKVDVLPKGSTVSVQYNGDPYDANFLRHSRAHSEYEAKFIDGTTCFMPADTGRVATKQKINVAERAKTPQMKKIH